MTNQSTYPEAEDQAERVLERIAHGPLEFDAFALIGLIHEAMDESGAPLTDQEVEELAESARLSDADREQILRELSEEYARDNRDY